MSDENLDVGTNSDPLRALGKQLAYDRPDAARRDNVRSSLLVAASEGRRPAARTRWMLVGGGFVAGALAAAAVAIIVLRGGATTSPSSRDGVATIESSSAAELERSTVTTATGTDELVRVRSGTLRLAVPAIRAGDHVRLQTGDAEVEGTGAYAVVVTADALASVTVTSGTATIRVKGQQQAVFLAAGETWRAPVVTAELDIAPAAPASDVATAPARNAASSRTSDVAIAPTTDVGAPINPATRTGSTPLIAPTTDVGAPTTSATRTGSAASVAPTTDVGAPINPGTRTGLSPSVASDVGARIKPATRTGPSPSIARGHAPTSRESASASSTTSSQAAPSVALAPLTSPAPSTTAVPTPTAVAPRPAITAVTDPAPVAPMGNSPTEKHFRAGYALLRANKYADAAIELGKAADGDGPLAADARYFQAVALSKAGRSRDAERALVAFLDRAPTSVRRGRASVMLARLLVERGDTKSARAWFESALADTDPSVAAAARSGLDALK